MLLETAVLYYTDLEAYGRMNSLAYQYPCCSPHDVGVTFLSLD